MATAAGSYAKAQELEIAPRGPRIEEHRGEHRDWDRDEGRRRDDHEQRRHHHREDDDED